MQATFRGIENDMVLLETANGSVSQVPLSRLTPEDQQVAKGIKLTVSRVWHTKDGGTVVATFRGRGRRHGVLFRRKTAWWRRWHWTA